MDFRSAAEAAAIEAGKLLVSNLDSIKPYTVKKKNDISTAIDLETEKTIVQSIKQHFPSHKVYSEESGEENKISRYVWLIDPIDGTINYFRGNSPFRIGICLLYDGLPIFSLVYNPVKGMMYVAEKGKGAYLNGKRIYVSGNADLSAAVLHTHLSSSRETHEETFSLIKRLFEHVLHVRINGSGLAALSYIAEGKFDLYLNVKTNPWDILPGALIITEAGGQVTDIYGNSISAASRSVLATNGKLHEPVLNLIKDLYLSLKKDSVSIHKQSRTCSQCPET